MTDLDPRVRRVGPAVGHAMYSSITEALGKSSPGDLVLVAAGEYGGPQSTERFPLYLPRGVELRGAGPENCRIDGAGFGRLSMRPLEPAQSLILMGDQTALNGFTIEQGGATAVAVEPGAHAEISGNTLQHNGQHGLLLLGPGDVHISNNRFYDNGTAHFEPLAPRSVAARQGHHIFIMGLAGRTNRVLVVDNDMEKCFADCVAMAPGFDEPDGVHMNVRIFRNRLAQAKRNGLTIAGSFGPSNTQVTVDVRGNRFHDNKINGIDAQGAFALVERRCCRATLNLTVVDNDIVGSIDGINAFGAFGPASGCRLKCKIVDNRLSGQSRYGVRLIGAVGVDGYEVSDNQLSVIAAGNHVASEIEAAFFIQGGIAACHEATSDNLAIGQFLENRRDGKGTILLANDGHPGNAVRLLEPSQDHRREDKPLPYKP